jgi:hypothetical protein
LVRIKDHEWKATLGKLVSDREAGLASTDNYGLDTLWLMLSFRLTRAIHSFIFTQRHERRRGIWQTVVNAQSS